MRRDSVKLLVLAGIVAFAVLYGMELSSNGISRVYGPMDQPEATRQPAAADQGDWTLPPRATKQPLPSANDPIVIPRNDSQPLIDRVSATAAETLHSLSSGGIRFVVSLFDKVMGS